MKICPKCSIRYSEMWNICTACKWPLKKEGPLKKIFNRSSSPSIPPLSLIESVIDQANTIFLYLNKGLKPIICSQAIEYITGYSREEVFKGDWLDLLFRNNPARKDMFKAFIESCLTSIKSRVYECAVTKKDKSECVLSWKCAAVMDTSGAIAGIICTAHDITERKSSEDDIVAHLERLRNIFASVKDYALITTNFEHKISYYEKGTAQFFGWVGDMTMEDISAIFPEKDRDRVMAKIEESLTKHDKFEGELELLRNKQEVFPAMLTAAILFDNKEEKAGYVYVARDITKRKSLEEQMIHAEKLVAIGQLAAGVAHEINNPLLVILGRLDMLSMEDQTFTPEVKRTVETIRNQARRMRIIVDRLLSYSRGRKPKMDIVDVNEILRSISPLLAYHPEFKKIAWKEKLAKGLPKIHGDFNQLQEMFLNFGLNACQAMPEGGAITITSKDRKDGFIEVDIQDTGVGIKEEDLKKLFTPFFSTRDTGTGLGLAICHTIVSSHGGEIKVESEPQKGTTFRISLPVKK